MDFITPFSLFSLYRNLHISGFFCMLLPKTRICPAFRYYKMHNIIIFYAKKIKPANSVFHPPGKSDIISIKTITFSNLRHYYTLMNLIPAHRPDRGTGACLSDGAPKPFAELIVLNTLKGQNIKKQGLKLPAFDEQITIRPDLVKFILVPTYLFDPLDPPCDRRMSLKPLVQLL